MVVKNKYDGKIDLLKLILWFHLPRGGSRAAATSKMERFVIIVNG